MFFAAGRVDNGYARKVFWPNARLFFEIDAGGEVARYEWRDLSTGRVTLVGTRVQTPSRGSIFGRDPASEDRF
jgi:hypothetical protein